MTGQARTRAIVAGFAAASLALSGCATVDPATDTRSEVEKAIAGCVASVAVGALLGAVIGNNTGEGNARRGAVVGAGAGGALCAVMMAMASERDKQRIAALQQRALEQDAAQSETYVGNDGKKRTILTTVQAAPDVVSAGATLKCRHVGHQVTVQGVGTANVKPQLTCRYPDGSYGPPPAAGKTATV